MPKTLPTVDVSAPICCAPLSAGMMSDDEALELALRLKALANPVRLRLMSLLMGGNTPERGAGELAQAVGVTAGTMSHHLNRLRSAGLVSSERRGVSIVYRAEPANLEAVRRVLATCC